MSLFRKLVGVFQAAGLSIRKRLLGGPAIPFVEDVFSTTLYTGTSATQTITNNIDLSTNGGLVWLKNRNSTQANWLFDSDRGAVSPLSSNRTNTVADNVATYFGGSNLCVFNSNGFTFNGGQAQLGTNGNTYTSWTFRKKSKFFDIVTYTGNGVAGREIPHNLGSVPGCVIIKAINGETNWPTWHRGMATDQVVFLNTTDAKYAEGDFYATAPTSSVFTVYSNGRVNGSGSTYVAYLFAHDAGGFGLTGTDSIISCGSVTSSGGVLPSVNLGWEPQWLLMKGTGAAGFGWTIQDNMRGSTHNGAVQYLRANTTGAENADTTQYGFSSTGLNGVGTAGFGNELFIYIAIRRGPMKVPTVGTSVFGIAYEGSTTPAVQSSFPIDFGIWTRKDLTSDKKISSRLQGAKKMYANYTTAEESDDDNLKWDYQNGYKVSVGASGDVDINWMFRRAPGFFDVVCFRGTGANGLQVNHNLGVTPELIIIKGRSNASNWSVFVSGNTSYPATLDLMSDAVATNTYDQYGGSSTIFQLNGNNSTYIGKNGQTYVAYLFATCPGVSKVGSYTGTATTKQIDCGFTAGARFVLIKRTDSTGDWYVWDTTRGIISGNDPYLLFNSTATEVTNTDYIDPYSAGFELSSTAPAAINANGGTYIFLAIA